MIRDVIPRSRRILALSLLILAAGLSVALLLFQLATAPPRRDALDLLAYFAVTATAALTTSWVFLEDRLPKQWFGLRGKAFLASAAGGLLGLLNVLVIARLMFTSTTHDLWVLTASVTFSIAVMGVFAFVIASSIAGRVRLVSTAIRSLTEEGERPDRESDPDEIGVLIKNVEQLRARLQTADAERRRADQERRNLTAAISHDLRTPTASVRAMAEALSAGVLEEEADKLRYLAQIQREMERLGRMIDDLFDLAQLDAGALELNRTPIQFEEIVIDVLEGMRPQARERDVVLEFDPANAPFPTLNVDGARMERVVANLVRNALEHTPSGGKIVVSLSRTLGWLVLAVGDTGEGFNLGESDRLWNRFYRGDDARGRQRSSGDGAGLGLSIVKGFVEAHRGKVHAASNVGRGATFTVELPLDPEAGDSVP